MFRYKGGEKLPLVPVTNYDDVAPFYDWLSRLIFGNSISNAGKFLVKAIPANSLVLIAGGGTGQILDDIVKYHSSGLVVIYVDSSRKMTERAKKRNLANNEVIFVNKQIQEFSWPRNFDVVVTPFLLDNFSETTARFVFNKLNELLKPDGLWLFSDFNAEDDSFWQKTLLKAMYLFFRRICRIEATHLPKSETFFKEKGYRILLQEAYYKNFISAVIYKKALVH